MGTRYWCGIALPWGMSIPSVIEPKDDQYVLRSSVLWIVLTQLQERVMQPTFGCNLMGLLHEPADAITSTSIRQEIKNAIQKWDNRITFVDVKVQVVENTINVTIEFSDKADPNQVVQTVEFQITPDSVQA